MLLLLAIPLVQAINETATTPHFNLAKKEFSDEIFNQDPIKKFCFRGESSFYLETN